MPPKAKKGAKAAAAEPEKVGCPALRPVSCRRAQRPRACGCPACRGPHASHPDRLNHCPGSPLQTEASPSPVTAAAAQPGSARSGGRRRGPPTNEPPVSPKQGGAGEPGSSEQPSKKRRKERRPGDGGTTSAAAAAAAVAPPADAFVPANGADALSPLSPTYEAGPAGHRRADDRLMEAVVKVFTVHSEPNFSLVRCARCASVCMLPPWLWQLA